MAKVVVLGEGMLELSADGPGWRLAFGGDTLNTAIHLARFGHDVAFATALGTDAFSDELRRGWRDEGLDVSLVLTDPDRLPGLYAIRTEADGERSFTYWRDHSAARQMFTLPGAQHFEVAADRADLLLFSLISVAILPHASRAMLRDLCRRTNAGGGRVAFDGNYRPKLWRNTNEGIAERDAAIALSDIGLPTLEDELALSGPSTAEAVSARWRELGARETVVKLGAEGCMIDGRIVSPASRLSPIDTSGAGDAFNAGYLHARLGGALPADAARCGHELAAWSLMRRGAVPALDGDAPYLRWAIAGLRSNVQSTTAPIRSNAARETKSGL